MGIEIVVLQECSSWRTSVKVPGSKPGVEYTVAFDGPEWASCGCPGFKYRQECRHIEEAAKASCHWHQQWSEERIEVDGTCPRCGQPTIYVRVGV